MKTISFLFAFLHGTLGFSQVNVGHVNSEEILDCMPEWHAMQEELKTIEDEFTHKMTPLAEEMNKIVTCEYGCYANPELMQKDYERWELLLQQVRDYEDSLKVTLESKQVALSEPIINKVRSLIQTVADEQKMDAVLDSSTVGVGEQVLYLSDRFDLTYLVLEKLNEED